MGDDALPGAAAEPAPEPVADAAPLLQMFTYMFCVVTAFPSLGGPSQLCEASPRGLVDPDEWVLYRSM